MALSLRSYNSIATRFVCNGVNRPAQLQFLRHGLALPRTSTLMAPRSTLGSLALAKSISSAVKTSGLAHTKRYQVTATPNAGRTTLVSSHPVLNLDGNSILSCVVGKRFNHSGGTGTQDKGHPGTHPDMPKWKIWGFIVVATSMGFGNWKLYSFVSDADKRAIEDDTSDKEWLSKNFRTSLRNLEEGRYWTFVTGVLGQDDPEGRAWNMLGITLMAPGLLFSLTPVQSAAVVLGGGLLANAFALGCKKISGREDNPTAGLAGPFQAMLTFTILRKPYEKFIFIPSWAIPATCLTIGVVTTLVSWIDDEPDPKNERNNEWDTVVGGVLAGALLFSRFRTRLPPL